MAFDAFVKIDGIPGEALDEQYRDWIEVNGYNFGTHQVLQPRPVPTVEAVPAARP
jgi:type VI protein secretion system component Hcp